MKKTILAFSLAAMIFFTVLTVMAVGSKGIRQGELYGGLPEAAAAAVKNAAYESYGIKAYAASSIPEMTADFIQKFCLNADSSTDFTIKILDADVKGLISAEVTAAYGNTGRVAALKTAVYEKNTADTVKEPVTVTYSVNGEIYKVCTAEKGSSFKVLPGPEADTGGLFSHWVTGAGENLAATDIITAGEDMQLTAVFKQNT